jgi:hypothetical protein
LEIVLDGKLSKRDQRELVIHEILENFFPSIEHSKIDVLTEKLLSGLDEV